MTCKVFFLTAVLLTVSAHAQEASHSAAKPSRRAEATAIIANARKILTPNGIERLEKIQIGGIDQWISIRGVDRRNPVLVVIHGGPGYVDMPTSWWFGRGWEEYFTVVYWDQRAAGKTQLLSDSATIKPTLTVDRMVADAEELVAWIRKDLHKERVFVLGHSWGSYPGILIAQRHPAWLHAYIGVGQLSNGPEGERRSWSDTLALARKAGNAQAVRELQALAPYAASSAPMPIETILAERKWVARLGGTMAYRTDNSADSDLIALSPDYTDDESLHAWDGNAFATPILLPQILSHDLGVKHLEVPLIIFAGRYDINVDSTVVAEWFAKVTAPEKHLVWFEHSAHLPMTEEPGKFLISLVRYARPVAERAGDVAPVS
jgi:pimeloyl-ACP methyl ester carboxylesterase